MPQEQIVAVGDMVNEVYIILEGQVSASHTHTHTYIHLGTFLPALSAAKDVYSALWLCVCVCMCVAVCEYVCVCVCAWRRP